MIVAIPRRDDVQFRTPHPPQPPVSGKGVGRTQFAGGQVIELLLQRGDARVSSSFWTAITLSPRERPDGYVWRRACGQPST